MKSNLDDCKRKLIDIGTCGLHVLHGAFRTGHEAAGWTINDFLRAIYMLFKDSPARKADFTSITGSTRFAKKFCSVRWVENVEVASRALEVLPHVKKYMAEKSKKLPKNSTCKNIQLACSDPFICAKTQFFISIASVFEPFLRKYQTNNPMVPFMYNDLGSCVRNLMNRFVKKEIFEDSVSCCQLTNLMHSISKCLVRKQSLLHCGKSSSWPSSYPMAMQLLRVDSASTMTCWLKIFWKTH